MVNRIWNVFHRLPVAMALAALLVSSVVCRVAFADEETYVVDANSVPCMATNHHYTTINAAVAAAASDPGVTINVCPGKYGEQVVLNTSVTLRGVTVPSANSGNGAGAAVITVPSTGLSPNANATLSQFVAPPSIPIEAQVLVHASNVTLSDLAIDGSGALPLIPQGTNCSFPATVLVAGVDFDSGSSGTVRRLAVRNQNQAQDQGNRNFDYCRRGLGILANQGAGEVTIRDSSISNFDSVGIDGEVPLTVENNSITQVTSTGAGGPLFALAIVLDTTASPPTTITSNLLVTGEGIECLKDCPGITISGNDFVITYGGCGIYVTGVGATIDANELSGSSFDEYAIMAEGTEDNVTHNVMSSLGALNSFSFGGIGIQLMPNANDTVTGNTINEAANGIERVTGNTVQNNTFHNVDVLTTP